MAAENVAEKIVYKAYPLAFCAGVQWTIDNARRELATGEPVFVIGGRLVNNNLVNAQLTRENVNFVDTAEEVPDGVTAIIPAHGGTKREVDILSAKQTRLVDSTCPLVNVAHVRVDRALEAAAKQGKTAEILYICKDLEHREPRSLIAKAPKNITPIRSLDDIEALVVRPDRMYFVDTQTTLNYAKAKEWIAVIKTKIPDLRVPPSGDVCYATENRQSALLAVLDQDIELLIAFGSTISSNTGELVKLGKSRGVDVELFESADLVTRQLVDGKIRIGITAGASAPPEEPDKCLRMLESWGFRQTVISVDDKEPPTFKIRPSTVDYRQYQPRRMAFN